MPSRGSGKGSPQERLQNKIIINKKCLPEALAKGSPQERVQNKIIINKKCLPARQLPTSQSDPRRVQAAPWKPQEAPQVLRRPLGGPRRPKEAPGGFRKPQKVPEGPQDAPQEARPQGQFYFLD